MQIKLIKSTFHNEDQTKHDLSEFILKSSKLSMGDECSLYEKEFSNFQGRKYTTMYNSGSSANLALIQALLNLERLKVGDICAFSSVTWSTNVMPIIQLGLSPIPVDVNLSNLNVGSKEFLRTLSMYPNIKCLFITNILGFCSDIDKIREICDEKKIILIEDNCESLGTEYKNKKLGNFGIASTCSSFVGHHLSTIEGGTISTDDEELSNMFKIVRAHGWNRNLDSDLKVKMRKDNSISNFYDTYTFYDLAYNLRPSEINGFLGRKQIKYIEENISSRQKNFENLNDSIKDKNNLLEINNEKITRLSNFAFPIVYKNKDDISHAVNLFNDSGVEIRPIVAGNITNQPFYKKYSKHKKIELSNADHIHAHGFYLPNHPELNMDEISYLKDLINKI
jgi:CDP-6-deoxy-D-xylo-4-hexulose-3-dehydrase